MAGTEFSPDRGVKAGPGRHVGPGPGPMQRRSDRVRRQAGRQRGPAGISRQAPGTTQRQQGQQLGHPWGAAGSDVEEQQPTGDYRHVQLLAQHQNMQGLGREVPFGIHATLTGEYRSLFNDPDRVPFDVFEDV